MKKFSSFNSLFVAIFAAVTLSTFLSQKAEAQYVGGEVYISGTFGIDPTASNVCGYASGVDPEEPSEYSYVINHAMELLVDGQPRVSLAILKGRQYALIVTKPNDLLTDGFTSPTASMQFYDKHNGVTGFIQATYQASLWLQANKQVVAVKAKAIFATDKQGTHIKVLYYLRQ